MKPIFSLLTLFILCIIGCGDERGTKIITVDADDPRLKYSNGFLSLSGENFNGIVEKHFGTGRIQTRSTFKLGKEEGPAYGYYPDGSKESYRDYLQGEKEGVHTGWWQNGEKRFEYHFENGVYDGPFREWYFSGKMMQEIIYAKGKEVSGKGWRENGDLYMNFVWKGNRRYGLVNPNLCFGVENGKVY